MTAEDVEVPAGPPLVVDVDGTLLRSDLLHEAALQFVAYHPFQAWRLILWLAAGKAGLKARLAAAVDWPVHTVPTRVETAAAIRAAKAEGRRVVLASASDRRWVEAVAAGIGGVDEVIASDGDTNLAGVAKAEALVRRFGTGGFDYIGDHRVDIPVWEEARRRIMVAHRRSTETAVRRRFQDVEVIARPRATLRAHWRALRVHQWAKNLLVFLPLIAGHSLFDPAQVVDTLLAFAAFCCAASSAYVINDLLDLPGDRDHPRKHSRPFAAGDLSIARGLVLSSVLMAAALVLASPLPLRFMGVLLSYVVCTLAYSLVLKRRLLIDVITLGSLYTLRVFGGVAATDQVQSQWLLMFSLFLFLSLAAVKRCSELVARREAGRSPPPGRGYIAADLQVLFPLAAAAGYAAVLVVTLYLSSPEVAALYAHPSRMWLLCPVLLYWVSRVLVLSSRNELHDDPVIFALTDRVSWGTAALLALIIVASL